MLLTLRSFCCELDWELGAVLTLYPVLGEERGLLLTHSVANGAESWGSQLILGQEQLYLALDDALGRCSRRSHHWLITTTIARTVSWQC